MEIVIGFLIFFFGAFCGFLLHLWLSKTTHVGIIRVEKNEGKTVYSLELDDSPEKLESKNQVSFKIVTSDVSPDRE